MQILQANVLDVTKFATSLGYFYNKIMQVFVREQKHAFTNFNWPLFFPVIFRLDDQVQKEEKPVLFTLPQIVPHF